MVGGEEEEEEDEEEKDKRRSGEIVHDLIDYEHRTLVCLWVCVEKTEEVIKKTEREISIKIVWKE